MFGMVKEGENMKRFLSVVCITGLFSVFTGICSVSAFEDVSLIEPAVDMDMVVIRNNQSVTVTADLSGPLDFQLIPVIVLGKGTLRVTMSRTNTHGELVYLYLYGFDDFLGLKIDGNMGITPVSLTVSSINGLLDYNIGFVISGILVSAEEPPFEYNVSFSF